MRRVQNLSNAFAPRDFTWLREVAFASLLLLDFGLTSAHAATPPAPALPEDPFFAEVDEVLTATRLAQHPQDAPAAVFVIDREMIETSGAREIADLLRLAPGFIVASDGTTQRAVGYRGFVDSVGRRLQVLVDGRSVYMPFYGGTAWSDIPVAIDDIERIEVIRGPNGAAWGANAFQGVVNIRTRHPDASQGLYLRAASGQPDYTEAVFRQGLTHGPLEMRYTLGYAEDSGFKAFLDDVVDGKELGLATLDMMIDAGPDDRVRLQAGVKRGDVEVGGNDVDFPAGGTPFISVPTLEDPPREMDIERFFGQLDWEHQLGDGSMLQLLAYAQQSEQDDDYPTVIDTCHPEHPANVPGAPCVPGVAEIGIDFSRSLTERRYAIELQHLLQPRPDLRLVWGGELRYDEVDSVAFFGPGNKVDDTLFRLFGNAEWRVTPQVVVNAGLMLEDYDLFEDAVSPRLAVNFSPNGAHTFRVAASRSSRTPSMWEGRGDEFYPLDIDFGAGLDGEVDAIFQNVRAEYVPDNETVDALELGWLFDHMADTGLRGDVKFFYERYEDMLIDYPYGFAGRDDLGACAPVGFCANFNSGSSRLDEPNPVTYGIANQIEMDFYGLEATLEFRPSPRARIIGSYTINKLRNLSASQPALLDYAFNDFGLNPNRQDPTLLDNVLREWGQSYPANIFNVLVITRPTPEITLSTMVYHMSETQFLEIGDDLPGYTRVDFRAGYRFRLGDGWQAELYGVVQNLGGDYLDFEQFNAFETRVFGGIKVYQ